MKIAMLTNNYKPIVGGVPISIDRLSGALRQRGHEVTIFAPSFEGEKPEAGVVRFSSAKLPTGHGMVWPNVFDGTIARHFERQPFDLVHVHHPMWMGKTGLHMARRHRLPIALTYHTRYEYYLHYIKPYAWARKLCGHEINWIIQLVTASHLRFMDACQLVFAPSPLIRDHLCALQTKTPVRVLPTGLGDSNFIWDAEKTRQIKQRYGQGKPYLFGSVSRLAKEKNITFLLEALAYFKETQGDCFRMLMMGDGPLKRELAEQAYKLGLGSNIIFTGIIAQEELCAYYRACDLFLFASQSETQGLVVQEAMAAALPVVAVEAGGVCDVVGNGENGYMTGMNREAFAHAIREALADEVRYTAMRDAAYQTAAAFTDKHMAASAEEAYAEMLARHKGTGAINTRLPSA